MNPSAKDFQKGATLIEALVAILIFSIGILALVGLYATSVKLSADAKIRADAAYLANQIIGHMWADREDLADYVLNSSATLDSTCSNFSGTPSSSGSGQGFQNLRTWWGSTSTNGTVLGMLPSAKAQIKVETGTNVVTVTLCWKAPQETETHTFTSSALISG